VLVRYASPIRVIEPPDGIKDVRAWKRLGATSKPCGNGRWRPAAIPHP
jgi:hypothetical protein